MEKCLKIDKRGILDKRKPPKLNSVFEFFGLF